ncbi:MAG: SLBB domain-containing protein [Parvularculaceae bacterium]|nr:SLBB domain-containing protein [Parvularculaceae bacterium]
MTARASIFVPLDSVAIALGADEIAAAFIAVGHDVVRTGSRGMHWLEPLIEIERDGVRFGFGPVEAVDVSTLIAAIENGRPHPKSIGPVEALPYFKRQKRLTFARCGVVDPLSVEDYRAHGGFKGLERAASKPGAEICEAILESGLRGRGGAGFPAGIKWRTVSGAVSDQKYIVCNADEGDSGTFADRMIMEGDPFLLIEGMAIAARAVGATQGFIYLRSEYPVAARVMGAAIKAAYDAEILGTDAFGAGRRFDLELFIGAGAYICGEETSLLNSLEGKRGEVRAKPPLPALEGLFGKPTLVQNVLTFCAVPTIIADGAKAYASVGVGKSTGTMPFQLSGDVKHAGLFEAPFGMTLRALVEDIGGGTRSGRPIRAIQIGGPLGAYLPPSLYDTAIDYEALAAIGAGVGHGGVVVFNDSVDLMQQARYAFEFCAEESCGKCTPCRIGAVRGVEVMDRLRDGEDPPKHMEVLKDLCELMVDGSLCAMGGMTPIPVESALKHFPEDFAFPSKRRTFGAGSEKPS